MFLPRLVLLTALAALSSGCVVYAPTDLGLNRSSTLSELELEDAEGYFVPHKIVVIPIDGEITGRWQGSFLSPSRNPVADIVAQLDLAREDEDVRAIVLRINSPGGSVTASDQIHRELLAFKEATGLPVIATFMDTAASGGYYVAMAADEIVAHPTTVTGSIGVVMELTNIEGMFDLIGLEQSVFTTGAHKDMGSPHRAISPEEQAMFQGIIDEMHGQFVDVVDRGRPQLDRAEVERLADGRVYTARQALDAGLVDHIGYLDDALARARAAAGITDAHIISYRLGRAPAPNVYGAAASVPAPTAAAAGPLEGLVQTALGELAPEPGAHFLYLWQPGS